MSIRIGDVFAVIIAASQISLIVCVCYLGYYLLSGQMACMPPSEVEQMEKTYRSNQGYWQDL